MDGWSDFQEIVRTNVPLGMYTWFQLGGNAEYFAEPRSMDEFLALVQHGAKNGIPLRVLGSGSNVLVRSEQVPGMVVRMAENLPSTLEVLEGQRIRVGGNVPLSRLITTAVGAGLAGLEDLIGIPGTVGGALHGNIGTDTTSIGSLLTSTQVLNRDGTVSVRKGEELLFGYRQSNLDDCWVLSAEFTLRQEDFRELAARMQTQWIVRKSLQPMGHQSTGRIFRNPTDGGSNASEIIERAGLKGMERGGAVVCERHANYITVEPDGTSDDVWDLIQAVQEAVFQKTGISLELELEIW